MEIGCGQGEDALREIQRNAVWESLGVLRDLAGLDRVVWGVSGQKDASGEICPR